MTTSEVDRIEQSLLRTLAGGAALSTVAGATAWAVGARGSRTSLAAFGRQTLAWGAVDGAIAAVGETVRRRRRTGAHAAHGPADRARSLRRTLLVNATLDVGYVACGIALVAAPDAPWARRVGPGARGDGVAIAVQAAFLLLLDLGVARRLGPHTTD